MQHVYRKDNKWILAIKISPMKMNYDKLKLFLQKDFPEDTTFQFLSFSSKNVEINNNEIIEPNINNSKELIKYYSDKKDFLNSISKNEYINLLIISIPDSTGKVTANIFFESIINSLKFISPTILSYKEVSSLTEEIYPESNVSQYKQEFSAQKLPETLSFNTLFDDINNYMNYSINQGNTKIYFSLTISFNTKKEQDFFHKNRLFSYYTNGLESLIKFFPSIESKMIESRKNLEKISRGENPVVVNFFVGIIDDSLEKILVNSKNLKNILSKYDFQSQEVQKDSKQIEFVSFSSICAKLIPIVPKHKFGGPVLTFLNRRNEVVPLDIFDNVSGRNIFTCSGYSGVGKSYLTKKIIVDYLVKGSKFRIVDNGGTYKYICENFGGKYIDVKNQNFNFFTNINTNDKGEIEENDLYFISELILSMASIYNKELLNNRLLLGYIFKAIQITFQRKGKSSGMNDFIETIIDFGNEEVLLELLAALSPFGENGYMYGYFNGENNIDLNNDLIVFDFDNVNSKEVKEILLMVIAHNTANEFYLDRNGKKKFFIIDELFNFINNEIVPSYLEMIARRLRKYSAALGLVTQSLQEFFNNKMFSFFNMAKFNFIFKEKVFDLDNSFDKELKKEIENLNSNIPYYSEFVIKMDNEFNTVRLVNETEFLKLNELFK